MKIPCLFIVIFILSFVSVAQQKLERISVENNEFINSNGEKIVFRGLNTSDPDKLEREGQWNKNYFEAIKSWNANIVRFPVHPSAWQKRGKAAYLSLLDQGIAWAEELGLYVIIDWHSIGNLYTEKYQHEMYNTTKKETFDFWQVIAQKYGNNPTVAFYELFNEPTTNNDAYGKLSWEQWKHLNEKMIFLIRQNGGKGIPLVAGFNWAYSLTEVKDHPIKEKGIGYVSHPYPQKNNDARAQQWTKDWGYVKDKYPVILTEIGYCAPDYEGAHIPVISDANYVEAITNYADQKNISYVVWVFDTNWAPRLIEDWNFSPAPHGKVWKEKMMTY
jgi:aryl-phospho-beta-D-glucosidase BglC (GH1 family)